MPKIKALKSGTITAPASNYDVVEGEHYSLPRKLCDCAIEQGLAELSNEKPAPVKKATAKKQPAAKKKDESKPASKDKAKAQKNPASKDKKKAEKK